MVDLPDKDLILLKKILRVFAEGEKVVAYGSRIKGNAWKFSDLDLCIMSDHLSDPRLIDDLKDALSNSRLPIRVDVTHWSKLSDSFKKIILEKYEIIQEAAVTKSLQINSTERNNHAQT